MAGRTVYCRQLSGRLSNFGVDGRVEEVREEEPYYPWLSHDFFFSSPFSTDDDHVCVRALLLSRLVTHHIARETKERKTQTRPRHHSADEFVASSSTGGGLGPNPELRLAVYITTSHNASPQLYRSVRSQSWAAMVINQRQINPRQPLPPFAVILFSRHPYPNPYFFHGHKFILICEKNKCRWLPRVFCRRGFCHLRQR